MYNSELTVATDLLRILPVTFTTNSFPRQTAFSHWKSTYSDLNEEMVKAKETNFEKSKIFEHFRPKYHNYHKAFYNTENSQSIGLDGDVPFDKFFDK